MTEPTNQPHRSRSSVGELRHGILNLADAFAQSLALLSLALGVATATSAAAISAGAATPWAYIVAGTGCLCLASVIVRFTARMASAGGIYTYIARGLHPNGGFIGGWLYGTAFAVGISFVLSIGAATMATLFTVHTSWSPSWFQCFMILLGGLLLFAFFDIRLSTRTQLLLGAGGVAAILLLAIIVLAKGGDSGVTAQPLNPANLPSTHGLFLAVVFAFTGYIGFEAAAVLGEEAANPRRAIPRAILTAAVVAVVWYVFITWTMSVGFGVENASKWAQDVAPLDTLANRYSGTWLSVLVDIAVITSAFIASLAGVHLTARTFFAMGREGGLPRVFAWTHPRWRTPWVGIALCLLVTFLLGLTLGRHWTHPAPAPFTYIQFMALTATMGVLGAYILVALSGLVSFWRTRAGNVAYSVALDIILPLGAIAICGYTIYKSVHPLPPSPMKYGPWVALIWLGIGVVIVAWLAISHPERVRAFGSILGEGEAVATEPMRDTPPVRPQAAQ
jgi:amino acid transporter